MRHARNALLVILLTLAALEGVLQLTDPWGVKARRASTLIPEFVESDRGYSLPPGEYVRPFGRATIQGDLTRFVPDNGCGPRVVFFGDSLTFGMGVDDSETFVNLLARRLGINATNAAHPAHNITYIHRAFTLYVERDALLVWLVFENDVHLEHDFPEDLRSVPSVLGFQPLISRYWQYAGLADGMPPDWDNFYARMDAITGEYDNLILFAFDDEFGRGLAERYAVNLIPWYDSRISVVDTHPDAAGHIKIADSMYAILRNKAG